MKTIKAIGLAVCTDEKRLFADMRVEKSRSPIQRERSLIYMYAKKAQAG